MSDQPASGGHSSKTAEEVIAEAERLRDTLARLHRELTDLLAKSRELSKTLPPGK